MTTIYIVTSGEYSDYVIEGTFSTKKKAEDFKEKVEATPGDIEEWELDKRVTDILCTHWISVLNIATGNLESVGSQTQLAHPNTRVDVVNHYAHSSPFYPKGHIVAKSFVSQEHADKFCVEKYQEIQRQGG